MCVTCLCPGCILNIAEFPSIMKSVVKLFFEAINVRSGLGLVAAVQFGMCLCQFIELFVSTGLYFVRCVSPRVKIVTIDRRVMAFDIVVSIILLICLVYFGV